MSNIRCVFDDLMLSVAETTDQMIGIIARFTGLDRTLRKCEKWKVTSSLQMTVDFSVSENNRCTEFYFNFTKDEKRHM